MQFVFRIDANFVIKVADFGLTEDVYARNYFRQGKEEYTKLPLKWMAIESLHDGLFTEKSDVVSVCTWELQYRSQHMDHMSLSVISGFSQNTFCV